jgi:hypothetical protein
MWFIDETKNSFSQPSDSEVEMRISHDFGFDVDENDIVQQIFVSIVSHNPGTKLQDYWSKYSPSNVFLQIGIPDGIYLTSGGDLALVYKKRGVVLIYESYWSDNLFCPQNERGVFLRHFILTNTESPLDIYYPYNNFTNNRSIWLPIDESIGISIEQFYEKMLYENPACYNFLH